MVKWIFSIRIFLATTSPTSILFFTLNSISQWNGCKHQLRVCILPYAIHFPSISIHFQPCTIHQQECVLTVCGKQVFCFVVVSLLLLYSLVELHYINYHICQIDESFIYIDVDFMAHQSSQYPSGIKPHTHTHTSPRMHVMKMKKSTYFRIYILFVLVRMQQSITGNNNKKKKQLRGRPKLK